MTEAETSKILTLLYTEIGKPVPQSRVKLWAEVLVPVPYELGVMAAKRMILRTKFFGEPQLSDYREHVNHLHRDAKRALRPQVPLCSAAAARMNPKDREAYDERHK